MTYAALLGVWVALWPVAAVAEVTVFAAASLKTALDEIAASWGGAPLTFSYGGSSALARQIALGAPADVYISANVAWMDALEEDGHIQAETRVILARNALVLIGAAEATPLDALTPEAVATRIGEDRLAMALVEAVPAGLYGKAALTYLGLWDQLSRQVVQSDNVRAALTLVATGAVPYGIVYATDALSDPRVAALSQFPAEAHPPILYPGAVTMRGGAEAAAFLAHLQTPEAQARLAAHHFLPPGAP